MKKKLIIFLLIATLLPLISLAETKYIDGFSKSEVGEFPKGWRNRPGQGDEAKQVYKVQEENGNKYLTAYDPSGISVQIFKMAHWNIAKYPILKWRWRAKKLPAGANESIPAKNDSACGVYISFGLLRGNALKYVWSTSMPKGTYYKKNKKMTIISKEVGGTGVWKSESANILEDAKKAFGKVPDRVLTGIAVLTDGNATGQPAACDYDGFGYASE